MLLLLKLVVPGACQAHYAKYEPTILELKRKYEAAMKEKMLAGLERDKMAAKVGSERQMLSKTAGQQYVSLLGSRYCILSCSSGCAL